MKTLINALINNKGILLTVLNFFLAAAVFVIYDPAGLFPSGYKGAPPLIERKIMQDLKEIRISSAHGSYSLKKEGSGWFLHVSDKVFPADSKKTESFLKELSDARLYYEIQVNDESLQKYGFTENGNSIIAEAVSGSGSRKFRISESGNYSESMVFIPEKKRIYSLESDLAGAAGSGRKFFFRKRNLIPEKIKMDHVTLLRFYKSNAAENIRSADWITKATPVTEIARSADLWQIVKPVPSPARQGETESLAETLLSLEATDFSETLPAVHGRGGIGDGVYAAEIVYKKEVMDVQHIRILFISRGGDYWALAPEGDYAKLPRYEAERVLEAVNNPALFTEKR